MAVIEIAPHQFLIKEGDTITVNNLNLKDKQVLVVKEVLLIFGTKKTTIGRPYVKDAQVELEHLETKKGAKITVAKFRSKSRYRRTRGHRQLETHLLVKAIKFK